MTHFSTSQRTCPQSVCTTRIWLLLAACQVAAGLAVLNCSSHAIAQAVCLPAPRLMTTMPMGGQQGTEVTLKLTGQDLFPAGKLFFSHPGIKAEPKIDKDGKPELGQFVVSIDPACPAGIYEARVVTRLGSRPQEPSAWIACPN